MPPRIIDPSSGSVFHTTADTRGRSAWGVIALLLTIFAAQTRVAGQPSPASETEGLSESTELSKRLIQGKSVETDVMTLIIQRMARVEQRLIASFDAGPKTRDMQRRIIDELDAAIAFAIRKGGSGSSSGASCADPRRRARRLAPGGKKDGTSAGTQGSAETRATDGTDPTAPRSGPFHEPRRAWGQLPARDREEVIQGSVERSLEKFRIWIERYYQSLAEGTDE